MTRHAFSIATCLLFLAGCGGERTTPAPDPTPAPAEGTDEPSADEPPEEASAPVTPPEPLGEDVPDATRQRVDAALDAAQHLDVTIRAARRLGDAVYVLFEASRDEICVRDSVADGEPAAAARRSCSEGDQVRGGDGEVSHADCRESFLARVTVPAEEDGAVEVAATEPLSLSCHVDEVRVFRLADVDGTGRPEIELDYWGTDIGLQPGNPVGEMMRNRSYLLREAGDLGERFVANLATPDERGETNVARLEWRDANGDGRADIVLTQLELTVPEDPSPCRFDEATGWPEGAREAADGEPAPACLIRSTSERVFLYEPGSDRFRERRDG